MQTLRVPVNGLNIYCEQHGERNNPHLLLLHGWQSSADAFRLLIRDFSDRYFITAFDFPGFGKSDMLTGPWNARDYAQCTVNLIEALELRSPSLIGHSHGGRTILKLTGEKMYVPPKAILLGASGLTHKRTLRQSVRLRTFKAVKTVLTLPGIRKFSGTALDKARGFFGSADYKNAPEVLRGTLVRLVNEDLRPILPDISCPVLLIWGENDTASPVCDAQEMSRAIPDAGLCIIRGAGHFAFVERPYEVHRIIESFLGG